MVDRLPWPRVAEIQSRTHGRSPPKRFGLSQRDGFFFSSKFCPRVFNTFKMQYLVLLSWRVALNHLSLSTCSRVLVFIFSRPRRPFSRPLNFSSSDVRTRLATRATYAPGVPNPRDSINFPWQVHPVYFLYFPYHQSLRQRGNHD